MTLKLLNERHMEVQSLKGDCTGSSESTHVKMPHYWKSHVTAKMYVYLMKWASTRDSGTYHKSLL